MTPAMTERQSGGHGSALKLHRRCAPGEVSNARSIHRKPARLWFCEPEPHPAPNYITPGVVSLFAPKPGRGGARNRADRESEALTAAQVASLLVAERQAANIGLPFTRMITIHWEAAGVALREMAKATGRFLDLLTKALARHGSATAWLWVHEGGEGKGGHCHLLVHVPARLVRLLTGLQRGWLRRITGQRYRARVIRSKPIGGRVGLETGNPDLHATNLEAALAYVLKGATPDAAALNDLTRLEAGGRVIGKRCGFSQNIGAAARRTKP